MTRPLLIRGGRVIDPSRGYDETADVLLAHGRIEAVGPGLDGPDDAQVFDAAGKVVCPGLVDVHVHLREPGDEHKETIASGSRAAVAGGFTTICSMPNTDPPIDDPAAVGFVRAAGLRAGHARIHPLGAVSVHLAGERLAPVGEMVEAGAVGITDDGRPVRDAGLMRLALEYGRSFGIPVASHCEVPELSRGGSMNEGVVSTRLGLTGIPGAAEDAMIARDLFLAELTGGRLHVQHVSTRRGIELIRDAKARGVAVTAEGTPHHFSLTDEAVEGYRTHAKVNPPLRSEADRLAVLAAVADGTLDCIATDHAPHHYDEKEQAFDDAPFGLIGLETCVGISMTYLFRDERVGLSDLIHRMSTGPALAFGLEAGTLVPGAPGDVTVLDPDARWTVDARAFLSRSRNTPFDGWELTGRAVATVVGGEVAFRLQDAPA
ncbi:MAG TPA: dihydroorotase [Longimicrobiales bacterium]|nr:dihydroorotase [Longimicrobiales bacterium]